MENVMAIGKLLLIGNPFISPKNRQFYKSKRVKELIYNTLTLHMVRIKGLEPPRLSASDPKSDVATNYTISA